MVSYTHKIITKICHAIMSIVDSGNKPYIHENGRGQKSRPLSSLGKTIAQLCAPEKELCDAKRTERQKAPCRPDRHVSHDREDRAQSSKYEVGVMGLQYVRWDHCKSVADNFTDQFSAPPIPVIEIAESNGVDVVFADFGEHEDTVAGFCDFKSAKLYVNKKDSKERQVFTIAHEFGHWVLHREFFLKNPDKYPVFPRFQSPDQTNPFEKEANQFAACLLVPEKLLKPVVKAPVAALANIFKVSKTMMEFRVKNVR